MGKTPCHLHGNGFFDRFTPSTKSMHILLMHGCTYFASFQSFIGYQYKSYIFEVAQRKHWVGLENLRLRSRKKKERPPIPTKITHFKEGKTPPRQSIWCFQPLTIIYFSRHSCPLIQIYNQGDINQKENYQQGHPSNRPHLFIVTQSLTLPTISHSQILLIYNVQQQSFGSFGALKSTIVSIDGPKATLAFILLHFLFGYEGDNVNAAILVR